MNFSVWMLLWMVPLTLASHSWPESSSPSAATGTQSRSATLMPPLGARREKGVAGHSEGDVQFRRFRRSLTCPDSHYYDSSVNCCCKWCPAGTFKNASCSDTQDTVCSPCPAGTFLKESNYLRQCQRCKSCDPNTQREGKTCEAHSDVECECKEGWYRVQHADFPCQKCTECANREELKQCFQDTNTQCGPCRRGFYEDGDTCQPCLEQDCGKQGRDACQSDCPTPTAPPGHRNQNSVVLFSLLAILLIVGVVALCLRLFNTMGAARHIPLTSPPPHEPKVPLMVSPLTGVTTECQKDKPLTEPFPPSPDSHETSLIGPLSDDQAPKPLREEPPAEAWLPAVLYAIISEVPVRRWKEFMRSLSLPDAEMERVELEAGPSYRERQYQMLRLWSQRSATDLQNVYSALHAMDLPGCAQGLQEKLALLQPPNVS
ncbi:tumor necrosis factor receptor superfamily member 25 isoform X2 [Amia ocellicauda]|uniref:tumor necrosis factor receptor superfamily member 25 isoform X2 n=1 Tax=Amia ocellicauda TaxID=2972642 RepID=UPI003464C998